MAGHRSRHWSHSSSSYPPLVPANSPVIRQIGTNRTPPTIVDLERYIVPPSRG